MGCGMARKLIVGLAPLLGHGPAGGLKTSVTIDAEGMPCFSSRIPSSTLPDEHDPQSPMPATMTSQRLLHLVDDLLVRRDAGVVLVVHLPLGHAVLRP